MEDWVQNKKDYRSFCKLHGELPVFLQDWWLDVVCESGLWEVCLSKDKGGNIRGVLPFYQISKLGIKMIKMPDLTPYLGVWLNYPGKQEKREAIYRFQKKVTIDLISQLPKVAYYAQRHPMQLQNGLPFEWRGFKLNPRFSYRLDPAKNIDLIFESLKGSVRTELRKAEEEITIFESEDIELFYELQKKSFQRQSKPVPYTFTFFEKINNALKEKNQKRLLIARDKRGNHHAGVYLLWDDQTVYNLLQGADPAFASSGAIKALLWEGIQFAQEHQKFFDFEGGMMENIEPVFSAFGGILQPYFKIYKGGNFIFKMLSALKNG